VAHVISVGRPVAVMPTATTRLTITLSDANIAFFPSEYQTIPPPLGFAGENTRYAYSGRPVNLNILSIQAKQARRPVLLSFFGRSVS
jgi:hypothetical protein